MIILYKYIFIFVNLSQNILLVIYKIKEAVIQQTYIIYNSTSIN